MSHRPPSARLLSPLQLMLTGAAIALLLSLDVVLTELSPAPSHADENPLPAVAAPESPAKATDSQPASELLERARKAFEVIPDKLAGKDAPSAEVVELGHKLFFDPRISTDGVRSCVLCHQPALYGTDALPVSKGVGNKPVPRNAPTILNSGLQFRIHWDGVFDSVETQAKKALLGPAFGNESNDAAVERIRAIAGYKDLFAKAFPGESDSITIEHWGTAIGAYERTLLTPGPFDAYLSGKADALDERELRGLKIFLDTGCADCHGGAAFGGTSYEKFGVVSDYWKETKSRDIDKGRFNVTKQDDDLYVFKVPPLRNVAHTPPYFHDGSVATLPEAVRVMAKVQLDATLKETDLADLVAFLESLTGPLPSHFANAPILPAGEGLHAESTAQ